MESRASCQVVFYIYERISQQANLGRWGPDETGLYHAPSCQQSLPLTPRPVPMQKGYFGSVADEWRARWRKEERWKRRKQVYQELGVTTAKWEHRLCGVMCGIWSFHRNVKRMFWKFDRKKKGINCISIRKTTLILSVCGGKSSVPQHGCNKM